MSSLSSRMRRRSRNSAGESAEARSSPQGLALGRLLLEPEAMVVGMGAPVGRWLCHLGASFHACARRIHSNFP